MKDYSGSLARDIVIIGFAMFAVFFGAGNLIFPPQIGFAAGADWGLALAGLGLTGMLLPVLAVVAVGLNGGGFESLTRPVAPWFGTLLIFATMVAIAWLITIPRTAGVAFETGVMTLAPGLDPGVGLPAFVVLYFAATLYLSIDKSHVIDRVGRFLTPALLFLLVGIVIWAVLDPLGIPAQGREPAPFSLGFTTGYQTGDVFTGLLFGVIFIEAIRARGHTSPRAFRTALAGISAVTFAGLVIVYGGLEYLGATGSGLLPADLGHAELLNRLVEALAGRMGAVGLGVAVMLACLTTAVGATAVMAQYMTRWSAGRISYPTAAIVTVVVAGLQAFGGVEKIIVIAGPIFMLFYPVGICLVILGLVARHINDGVWKGTAVMALLIGAYDSIGAVTDMMGGTVPAGLSAAYGAIPLAAQGFAWVVPALSGGIIGGILWKLASLPNHDPSIPGGAR